LAAAAPARAHGLLIPEDRTLPPLEMVYHKVAITIEDQVAVTEVNQSFKNNTDRALEATYLFPVPRGASVNRFTMVVDGKDVSGEMVEADKARQIYTDIVRRTQDPGLLEYLGNNLMRMRVFPVPPRAEQKVALRYTSVAPQDSGVIEYVYPLKTDGKATATLREFAITATVKSQHAVQSIYSPTHAIALDRKGDQEVKVNFEKNQALLDKDFQLFYTTGKQEIGLTALMHRPVSTEGGYFMLLLSPQIEASKAHVVPRDMVLVLDTSGSMAGVKMEQAKRALKYCLDNLNPGDRFALMNFSTTVNKYREGLVAPTKEQVDDAKAWVEKLRAAGGTAIQDALASALETRSRDEGRSFTVVFFTDGQPTIGETNPDKILRNIATKNSANTRIFTFGVGDDVNASMLDQLAEQTRAVSSYVRPAEDIEVKVSGLYSKINRPVLTNVRLVPGDNIRFEEVFPPSLPDLFYGSQMVVLGRYTGQGPTAIKVTGTVGMEPKEFVYELTFAPRTTGDRDFVEHLWARRKVGFLLDQIRLNGETKELKDEVVALSKKYGIATPFTSYLIVPDVAAPVGGRVAGVRGPGGPGMPAGPGRGWGVNGGFGGFGGGGPGMVPPGLAPTSGPVPGGALGAGRPGGPADASPKKVLEYAKENQTKPGELSSQRGGYFDRNVEKAEAELKREGGDEGRRLAEALAQTREQKQALDKARAAYLRKDLGDVQTGKLGVDLAITANNLRAQERMTQTAVRRVNNRNCLELGGVWIDEGFDPMMPAVVVKAQSDAYFRILERQPQMREVLQLGNHLVFVTPNQTALVIDTNDGKDKLDDKEIDALFVAKK
jgi:Ca-activated chloride channel family protein